MPMTKNSVVVLLFAMSFISLGIWSCGPSDAKITLNLNTGVGLCSVAITMDGGSPVTETSSGSYIIYDNVKSGDHQFAITSTAGGHSACNYTVQGDNHTITVGNACNSNFSVSCN